MSYGMELLPGEHVVMKVDNDNLVLTNLRVRYSSTAMGNTEVTSITLDSVASVGLATSSSIRLLVIAALVAFAGFSFISQSPIITIVMILVAAALVVAYFAMRKTAISITAGSGRAILAPSTEFGLDACMKFINSVEREKLRQESTVCIEETAEKTASAEPVLRVPEQVKELCSAAKRSYDSWFAVSQNDDTFTYEDDVSAAYGEFFESLYQLSDACIDQSDQLRQELASACRAKFPELAGDSAFNEVVDNFGRRNEQLQEVGSQSDSRFW